MTWITIEHFDRRLRVPALKYQGRLWFHWLGETHVIELGTGGRRAGADKSKTHPGVISAPMPGKVTKVFVASNQSVSKGQALVVMEAMKMEYTLKADFDSEVDQVNCTEGEQVALGKTLVKFKTHKSGDPS